jgi:P-type conjugative transfer protein TrbG
LIEKEHNMAWKLFFLVGWSALAVGCGHAPAQQRSVPAAVEAKRVTDPVGPVELVEVPRLLPLPGQLKPRPTGAKTTPDSTDPAKRVQLANESARVEPARTNFIDATQVWPFSPDALYQVYTSPEKITDISLEAGEELVSVSAGDTVRWIIGDTTSGAEGTRRVHVLVKPTRPDLRTNLLINTNRRTYHLELSSTVETWLASVSWEYPLDQLTRLKSANARALTASPIAEGVALERLNFGYQISGDDPSWRPIRAFDDGLKVYLQFPADIAQGELPPLFVVGERKQAELVNYRVHAPYYIVDRLFEVAELRLGGKNQVKVRIERTGAHGVPVSKRS